MASPWQIPIISPTYANEQNRAHLFSEFHGIEHEVVVKDEFLVVPGSILIEQGLRQEGEILAFPDVIRKACAERDPSKNPPPSEPLSTSDR